MKKYLKYIIPSFITFIILGIIYCFNDLYPFGIKPLVQVDADYIYIPIMYKIWDILHYGGNIFYNCISLTSLTISPNVNKLVYNFSTGCANLKHLSFGKGEYLTELPSYFMGAIMDIFTIPKNISFIGTCAVQARVVKCPIATPPQADWMALGYTWENHLERIEIPRGSLAAYQSATNWSEYADKYVEVDFDD